jgi:hypothetical protein
MSPLPDLESMDRDALLALWSATLGGEPPSRLSQPFLRRVLAWEIQAKALGGLSPAVKAKLEALAAGKHKVPTPKVKTGGRFLREWGGITHVVDVVEGGFLWKGERHRSLSAIARAITGAHWSGPRFFGLRESGAAPAGAEKKAAGTRGTKVGATPPSRSSGRAA